LPAYIVGTIIVASTEMMTTTTIISTRVKPLLPVGDVRIFIFSALLAVFSVSVKVKGSVLAGLFVNELASPGVEEVLGFDGGVVPVCFVNVCGASY